jgi:hypothetical protein
MERIATLSSNLDQPQQRLTGTPVRSS